MQELEDGKKEKKDSLHYACGMQKCGNIQKKTKNNFYYLPTIISRSHRLDRYTDIMIKSIIIEGQHKQNL
jgi:hypothetical protein